MSAAILPEDQLIELLIQLQKTTPEQARLILNSQPQISYVLMSLMVKMNVVNMEVLQNQLAAYAASTVTSAPPSQVVAPSIAPTPAPVPQTHTPSISAHNIPSSYPPPSQSYLPPSQSHHPQAQYQAPAQGGYPGMNGQGFPGHGSQYGQPPSQTATTHTPTPILPDALANIPEEQRAMIMRVVSMPADQIARLPLQERSSIMQLRASLGLPTE